MTTTAAIAAVASLAGDPARAAMLWALMDGRALTAAELARAAGVTPQTASGHLARLADAGFLTADRQGRSRYFRLASPSVAEMVESLMQAAATFRPPADPVRTGPRDQALGAARTCYDHLAGRLGVAISDALIARGDAEIADGAGIVTAGGRAHLARLGIVLDAGGGRILCRPCLDWSERRPHLAGAVGAAICAHALGQNWVRRADGSRAVSVTPKGRQALKQAFGIVWP